MFAKRLFALAGVISALFLFCGCTVIREYAPAEEIKATEQEYELARQLLQAFIKNDAEGFVALLPEESRTKFTAESFATTRNSILESIGEPVAYTYVTTLKLETLNPQIWKVTFRRNNINKTKEFTSEVLFKVVTGMVDEKTAVITGFHFL